MSKINIFESATAQTGEFFKFAKVGDNIQGTYIDVRDGVDSFGNDQTIYVLSDEQGKIWNLGFRKTASIIHERMKGVRKGQIVGFKFDEERESKKKPGTKAKIIRIYADPRLVDHEWLKQQKELLAQFGEIQAEEPEPEEYPEATDGDIEVATAATPNLPKEKAAKAQNEALDAILNLAKTKGLTDDKMSVAEATAVVEKFAGMPLTEENYTKVIIKLTGYSK
jgi:hypothetical protein